MKQIDGKSTSRESKRGLVFPAPLESGSFFHARITSRGDLEGVGHIFSCSESYDDAWKLRILSHCLLRIGERRWIFKPFLRNSVSDFFQSTNPIRAVKIHHVFLFIFHTKPPLVLCSVSIFQSPARFFADFGFSHSSYP